MIQGFLKSSEGFQHASMVCSLLHMFCESIFNFSRTAEKREPSMRSDNAVVSGSIADRSNFMSDCKQMQVRLKNGKYSDLKRQKK